MKIRFATALLCLALTGSTVVSRAQQAPPPDALRAVVNGLTPSTPYFFVVRAGAGRSPGMSRVSAG